MSDNHLIIFIKYPEPGKVKTRLSKGIGKVNAAMLYKLFVETLLKRISYSKHYGEDKDVLNSCHYETTIFFSPEDKNSEIKDWLGPKYDDKISPQHGNNLGERIYNAFRQISNTMAKKVVIIGSDTPALDKETVLQAFDLLNHNDTVIGPTIDGGYFLLGLSFLTDTFKKDKLWNIFSDIDWSTENVFTQTIDSIKSCGLTYKLLSEYYDIDTLPDLTRLKHDIQKRKEIKDEHLHEIYDQLIALNIL